MTAAKGITPEQLATLSHEFRTPLNGVLGMARLLEGTRLTAEQKAYVTALRESGDHLLNLVNDVLDFARLGEERVELQSAPVEVEMLLRQVCELLSPRADDKRLGLTWAADADVGVALADEGRLRQVLLNFLGNALKFTSEGGVLLTATRPDPQTLRFTVADTGPGVETAVRDDIFRPFVQTPLGLSQGGTGLGLAIVRRLADAMGGQVGVETSALGGAAFWFQIAAPAIEPSAASDALRGAVVGIASPSVVVREAAARQVAASGGRPVVAADLETLLRRVDADAALVLDHALAETGALVPPPDRLALVLLRADERDRIEPLRDAGFAGYLVKPIRRLSLVERLLATRRRPATTLGAGPQRCDDRLSPAAPGARVLLVEDNPINALLARTLLEHEGCCVDHVADGRAALAAVADGDDYALILMDRRMPQLNGLETTRLLRQTGVNAPVVALTADAYEDDRRECLAAGMDDFVAKPISAEALRQVIGRWVGGDFTAPHKQAKVAP